MTTQNKIILFCYLYIAGIAAAMMAPVDPAWLSWLHSAVILLLLPAGIFLMFQLLQRREGGTARWCLAILMSGSVLFGYTRYIQGNTVPDMRVGTILVDGSKRVFVQTTALPDTSRIRLRVAAALDRPLSIRLRGELDARVPVRDERGRCSMDESGRWVFQLNRMPLSSEVVTFPAGETGVVDVVVNQPFSRIDGVEWIEGPEHAQIEVHRISNHIGSFVRPGRAQSPVTILGRITGDPRVYDFKTVLIITPAYVQYPAGGPFFRVEGGDIQVTVPEEMNGYTNFARTAAYGADVQLRGELTVARAESNPGGFDARQFMQNYNIFGLVSLFQPRDGDAPMHLVAPDGKPPRQGDALAMFSLRLRDDLLRIFKATMPYPQSAFLGGVVLGLRYGLQGTQFPGETPRNAFVNWLQLGRSEALIVDDFKSSGVNHVLAVSGLHVTIITAMFVAIFGLLRVPKKMYVVLVIFALVVFAIITGARPSTLRAVIMNSLFLLTWAYMDKSLLSSALLGVPVAAFLILLHNPLVVVDPSFTLSFGAILSLALITLPSQDLLSRLRGNRFLAVIVLSAATTFVGMKHWMLVVTPSFIIPWVIGCVAIFVLAGELQKRGIGLGPGFAFSSLPPSVGTFLAAQFAIQIGMMIPLSAYYFCRWPFGGAYANLIAIPLIGVVVQLGAIAGLLGLVPVVGPFLALLLNAANWFFTTFFLWLAHVFTLWFPYPFVRRPSEVEVFIYYVYVAAFVWHKPIWKWISGLCVRCGWNNRRAPAAVAVALAGLVALPLFLPSSKDVRPPGLHVTFLSVGYGSSVLVESPGGKNFLIDTGFVEYERGRRNEADRTILPFLANNDTHNLEALILTSPLPERSAGAAYIMDHLRINYLVVPDGLKEATKIVDVKTFRNTLGLAGPLGQMEEPRIGAAYHAMVVNPVWPRRPSLARALAGRDDSFINRWAGWGITTLPVKAGNRLFEEAVDGKKFYIEVLGPVDPDWREKPVENNGLVLRVVYGDFAILLTSTAHYEAQRRLAESWPAVQLKAQVMTVPGHGAAIPRGEDRPAKSTVLGALERSAAPLLDKVQPDVAIVEFGSPRPVLGDDGRTAINVLDVTRRFYADRLGEDALLSTDRQLAIMIHSDGAGYTIDTQAARNQAEGGAEDAVSDLSVGF